MPLEFYAGSSFNRSVRISKRPSTNHPDCFYKQLRRPYYEAGVESNLRVIIAREKQMCTALLAGNHDQIRRFLAGV